MTIPLSFSAFVMNTASHIIHGLWRDEQGNQINFNDIDVWISLAKTLEDGGFDAVFFADVIGLYGNHRGGWSFHVENGLQIPSNDPMVLMSALAVNTKHLGLAYTAAPLQEHPFNFARRISTLDHISKGRIAWNMVTSSSENAFRNFGYEGLVPHDERYRWLDEYVDVLYKLWEGSWDEGALKKDRESGIYADPTKVHKINHVGKYYKVEGPHLVSPSPQRTPLLFQAGASTTGRDFAARHAEAVFIVAPDPENARQLIDTTRRLAVQNGREGNDIHFYQGLSFVIGETEKEAKRKEKELDKKINLDMMIAHMAGGMGVDLGHYHLDTMIEHVETEGVRSSFEWLKQSTQGRTPTVRDIARLRTKSSRIVGTPESIADQLEIWKDAGINGVNVINSTISGSYEEFIEHVMPVLRKRGLVRNRKEETSTLRKKLFGDDYINTRHPAANYRGVFQHY
ncbi:NtaA/DmoA family FMN-dependent monooxygenase [Metabacillus niabensis]|uniref:FMN-dependent oxidoreductase (Nitrilotriacetate monooxygenase family) n=1 Tax=Metabacillus niabensis TaxID=324854 RepID=A0ABT9Z2K9_9BACI|nr:NtaA/DmoA family FMN-dependent monooxygenase [Metabacillus niabensis]MDQ0226189.1 FMN-dependent oxidoreductase (nitrilotriacetate monooxygenase family) [Metabacillus niabensis]